MRRGCGRGEIKKKILKRFESIEIIAIEGRKVRFRFKGFSGVYNINMREPKMPKWFDVWNESQFKPLVKKVDNLEVKVDILETKVDNLEIKVDQNTKRLDNIENRLEVLETKVDQNGKRLNKIDDRLDNLVKKNDLKE